jgi:hypothetical protein
VATSISKKLALASLTSGGRSVGIVRLRTEATEFSFFFFRRLLRLSGITVEVSLPASTLGEERNMRVKYVVHTEKSETLYSHSSGYEELAFVMWHRVVW